MSNNPEKFMNARDKIDALSGNTTNTQLLQNISTALKDINTIKAPQALKALKQKLEHSSSNNEKQRLQETIIKLLKKYPDLVKVEPTYVTVPPQQGPQNSGYASIGKNASTHTHEPLTVDVEECLQHINDPDLLVLLFTNSTLNLGKPKKLLKRFRTKKQIQLKPYYMKNKLQELLNIFNDEDVNQNANTKKVKDCVINFLKYKIVNFDENNISITQDESRNFIDAFATLNKIFNQKIDNLNQHALESNITSINKKPYINTSGSGFLYELLKKGKKTLKQTLLNRDIANCLQYITYLNAKNIGSSIGNIIDSINKYDTNNSNQTKFPEKINNIIKRFFTALENARVDPVGSTCFNELLSKHINIYDKNTKTINNRLTYKLLKYANSDNQKKKYLNKIMNKIMNKIEYIFKVINKYIVEYIIKILDVEKQQPPLTNSPKLPAQPPQNSPSIRHSSAIYATVDPSVSDSSSQNSQYELGNQSGFYSVLSGRNSQSTAPIYGEVEAFQNENESIYSNPNLNQSEPIYGDIEPQAPQTEPPPLPLRRKSNKKCKSGWKQERTKWIKTFC
jgi:hypothetical protein